MKLVQLRSAAWYGDRPLEISFPDNWDVELVEGKRLPPLSLAEMESSIQKPVGSPRLIEIARGRRDAVLLVDDLSRPTPAAILLPIVLDMLQTAGLSRERTSVVIAGGTHHPSTEEQARRKTGLDSRSGIRIISHNAHSDLTRIGKTGNGYPIDVNRHVAEADLKIAIGTFSPHSFAGFSGGSKMVYQGVCGMRTVRDMHSYLKGSSRRGGELDTEARNEMNNVGTLLGLDFILNVVLNQDREIAGLFTGHREEAFTRGVEFFESVYRVGAVSQAQVVVTDAYPFDTTFQIAYYRGFWPFWHASDDATRIAIAACSEGMGSHELLSVSKPLWRQAVRRLARWRISDFGRLKQKVSGYFRTAEGRRDPFKMLSHGITQQDLKKTYMNGEVSNSWKELIRTTTARHGEGPCRVVVYRCAPFLIPEERRT
ncbi:MAG: lactate racemase domain-containing protein [Bacteroidota bacterium]